MDGSFIKLPGLAARWRAKIRRVILPTEDAATIINGAAGGEEFILADGIHNLSGAIDLGGKTNITVRGSREAILNSSLTTGHIIDVGGTSGVTLKGFRVYAQTTGEIIDADTAGSITALLIDDLTLDSLLGAGGVDAIKLDISGTFSNCTIRNCVISGRMDAGIKLVSSAAANSEFVVITNNRLRGAINTDNGIHVEGNAAGAFVSCEVTKNQVDGFLDGIYVSDYDRGIIQSNVLRSNGDEGIEAHDSANITVTDNHVYNAAGLGIFMDNVNGASILTGNHVSYSTLSGIIGRDCHSLSIVGNGSTNNGSKGIDLENCDETMVNSNRCYANGTNGIQEDANCNQCLYEGNHLRGNTGAATNFNGTNRTAADNKT